MANDLRTIELLIKAASDQGASQQTIQQLERVAQRLDNIGASSANANRQIADLGASIQALRENPEVQRIATDLEKTTQAARDAQAELNKMTGQGAKPGGRFGGGIGPGGLGFAEFLGGMAVRTLPQGPVGQVLTSSLLGAGSINSIISQIQQMTKAMGGLGPALGSVLASLGPVTGAMLVLNGLLAIFNHFNEEAAQKVKAQTEALELYFRAIAEGTTQSIQAQLKKNEVEQAVAKGTLEYFTAKAKEVDAQMTTAPGSKLLELSAASSNYHKQLDEEQRKLDTLTQQHELLIKAYGSEAVATRDAAIARGKAIDEAVDEAERQGRLLRSGSSKEVREEIQRLTDRRNEAARQLAILNMRVEKGIATPEDVAKRDELKNAVTRAQQRIDLDKALLPGIEAREKETKEIENAIKAQDKRNQALEREQGNIARITDQMETLQRDRDKQLRRQAEDDAIAEKRQLVTMAYEARIAAAKEQEAEADYQAQLAALRDDERKGELKAGDQYHKQVEKINSDFMKSELKATRQFRDRQADDLEKFNKRYQRALEDMQDRLTDAASRRDVAAFIQAQRDGEKQLRRLSEDFADQDKERVASYLKERAAARDNRAEQLAEAEQNYRDQIRQLREQLQERLDAERQAHEKRVRQSEILEDEFANLREQWQREDNERRRQIEKEDFDERMAALDANLAEARAKINAINQANIMALAGGGATTPGGFAANVLGGAQGLISGGVGFVQNFLGGLGGTPIPASQVPTVSIAPTRRPQSLGRMPSRLQGGMDFVPHDFYPAYLDYGEGVLNQRENEAYRAGRSGGATVNIYATVGDVATKSMLIEASVDIVRGIRKALPR